MAETLTFGVGLTITNPLSAGYYAYLAAAEAALNIADELVIVDGGSTDGSLETLLDWVGPSDKITVINNEMTFWGPGDNWHWGQICVNLNCALETLSTDWGWAFSADYVLDSRTIGNFKEELREHSNAYWVKTSRGKPLNGRIHHHLDERNIIFNLNKIRNDKAKIGFGVDKMKAEFSDWPISFERMAFFIDPSSHLEKPMYSGRPIPPGGVLSVEFIAYGHFFYLMNQVENKIRRWDRARARYLGLPMARLLELKLRHRIHSIKGYYSKNEVLGWDHPKEMKRLVSAFYDRGMIGGALIKYSKINKALIRVMETLLKAERKARFILQKLWGAKGQNTDLVWKRIDDSEKECVQHNQTISR